MPFYSASTRSFNIPTFLIQFSHLPLYFMYLIGHRSSIEGEGQRFNTNSRHWLRASDNNQIKSTTSGVYHVTSFG
ncbi:hypothetical protein BDV10DRAFT_174937 [Aspergillus recurvatus]